MNVFKAEKKNIRTISIGSSFCCGNVFFPTKKALVDISCCGMVGKNQDKNT